MSRSNKHNYYHDKQNLILLDEHDFIPDVHYEKIHPTCVKPDRKTERKILNEARRNMVNSIEQLTGRLLTINWHQVSTSDIEKIYSVIFS